MALDFKMANVYGRDFSGADLRGANFKMANVTNVSFRGADLTDACFKMANLTNVDFTDATIDGLDLKMANLIGVVGLVPRRRPQPTPEPKRWRDRPSQGSVRPHAAPPPSREVSP